MAESGEQSLSERRREAWDRYEAARQNLCEENTTTTRASDHSTPHAARAYEINLQKTRDEVDRLLLEYQDLDRQYMESQMLELQRSQRLATWASFAVAAVVGLATLIELISRLVK